MWRLLAILAANGGVEQIAVIYRPTDACAQRSLLRTPPTFGFC